jgi:signal transduction histidine kinase
MPTKTAPKEVVSPSVESARFSLQRILDAARQEATGTKTSNYLITTAATGFFFMTVSLLVIRAVPYESQGPTYLLLSFIFALSFSPIRYASEELMRQLFPSFDYDSHTLIKRLNTISYSSLTLNELSTLFFQEFAVSFNVPESAFIFITGKNYLIKTSGHFTNLHSLKKEEINTLIEHLSRQLNTFKNLNSHEANHLLKTYHIKAVSPLTNNADLVGILLLGTKYNQKPYTTKDLKVLDAIAPKIGFAIRNARAYERVKHKNDTLFDELKTKNEALRQANRQLKKDDQLKDEFVYIATHELKNPVTAMKGYLSLIQEGAFGPVEGKLKHAVDQIDQSNQQLISLLNNLLNIARTEAQKLNIKTQAVAICKIIEEVTQDVKPLLDQKGLSLTHSCQNRAVAVMADKERLREIMSNLISNAIKYSETGIIDISHEIIQDQLVTHVKDQGVGISEHDQKQLFTRFFRVEEEAAKGIPGSGLGLFIVKQLIEKMGGKIWFQSKLGEGSTFSISLPLARTYALKSE